MNADVWTMPVDLKQNDNLIKTYKRRFWMLFLFVLLTTSSSILFSVYVSVANVTGCYYDVSQMAVNWTMEIQLLVYVLLVFPALFLVDYLGLRRTLICSSCLNVTACGIQFLSLKPNGFGFALLSCFFCAFAGLLVIGTAPYIAAKWFPRNELSRASSVGNFGNIVGVCIGFMITPLMVSSDCEQKSLIEEGKRNIAYVLLGVHSTCLTLIILTFQNSPPLPPSFCQLERKKVNAINKKDLLDVLTNKDFVLVFLMSGLMGAVFFSFSSTANNLMIRYFPGQEVSISGMTTLYTLFGLAGALSVGYILDYTHRFKETAMAFSFMCFVLYLLFCCTLRFQQMLFQYIFACGFGFFLIALFPIALEYGIEILFPVSELMISNFVLWALEACGLVFIEVTALLLKNNGPILSCSVTSIVLFLSCILSCFLTKNYKRSNHRTESTTECVA